MIKVCENVFYFYGGILMVIVFDNFKVVVVCSNYNGLVINEEFVVFFEYYGCIVYFVWVCYFKDKVLVENVVKLFYW